MKLPFFGVSGIVTGGKKKGMNNFLFYLYLSFRDETCSIER